MQHALIGTCMLSCLGVSLPLAAWDNLGRVMVETMNIDTISLDVQEASKAAMSAESRSMAFLEHYLEWIKAQQALLEKQITALEAKMKPAGKGEAKSSDSTEDKSSEKPADTGGDDGG